MGGSGSVSWGRFRGRLLHAESLTSDAIAHAAEGLPLFWLLGMPNGQKKGGEAK